MPIGARNRVTLAIRDHEEQRKAAWRRWLPAASFAAGAALVLAVIGTQWAGSAPVSLASSGSAELSVGATPTPVLGSFSLSGSDCHRRGGEGAATTVVDGDCRLVAEHMTVQVWEHAEVSAVDDAFVVHDGKVLFEVETVRAGETPVRVGVSHGAIEVVGTRFAVEQDARGGHVDLLEGKIRFHEPDGSIVDISPGQRHAWGDQRLSPIVAAEVDETEIEIFDEEPPSMETKRRVGRRGAGRSGARAAAVIERVTELRAQKSYRAAAAELRAALRRKWDRRTSQVLSYELGEILRSSGDTAAACRHFATHQRKFSRGLYHGAIERAMERLRCDTDAESPAGR